ncbi:DUF4124 domain-containing protein [Pseudoalteromonas sp. P1-25]|uniref:DUF4124 domain-containing protein n=1 Tax=Pseudoalteromonas sp. P1-25 TaxID=1723758 RepID=UPI0006D656A4|nr:DUF4124 domain-containing protein [Pseudoalteromonas sp. P1-25]KPZ56030.1 hypothetical protein AN393_01445 [Pseudoalteromonas sp. P1-25]
MKYFTYLAISVMIIAVISLFYLKKPDGQTWLSGSLISAESHKIKEKMVALSTNTLNQAVQGAKQAGDKIAQSVNSDAATIKPGSKIYKWQDTNGQWHFSDTPNEDGKSIEVTLDARDVTVVAAEDTSILSSANTSKKSIQPPTPTVYNAESIQKLFEDAEKAKQKLEQRSKEIQSIGGY